MRTDKRAAEQDHHLSGSVRRKHLPGGHESKLLLAQYLETNSCIERLKIVQTTQFLPDSWYPCMSVLRGEVAMVPQVLRDGYHPKVLVHAWQ